MAGEAVTATPKRKRLHPGRPRPRQRLVGRERDASDDALMGAEAAQFPPRLAVPEPDRVIGAPGEGTPTVAGDRHRPDRPRMAAFEGVPVPGVGHPPGADEVVPVALGVSPPDTPRLLSGAQATLQTTSRCSEKRPTS